MQLPVKGSTVHLPIAVASQSQLKEESWQNSTESQRSMFKKLQPLPLPQVVGSA